jgi:cobalt-zinc-cadmium efflux system membrane fusion protein
MKKHIIIAWIVLFTVACNTPSEKKETVQAAPKAATESNSESVELSDAQLKTLDIKTGKAVQSDVHNQLKVNGFAEVPPENQYSISFPMSGYLRSNKLIPGTYVSKGTLMATLEDARFIQLQQDYLTVKSKLAYAEADYHRQEELNQTKSTSDKQFQQAKTDYESQKIQLRALGEQLRLIGINPEKLRESTMSRTVNIYAPISGYVNKVNVNPGKYVSPTDVLFELTDPSKLHLSLNVFEKDAQGLKAGQKVICYTNANPDEKMQATIHIVNRNIGDSRSVEVHCDFDQNYKGLMPGTFLNAVIQMDHSTANAIPEDAVVRWQNKYYIFVAQSSTRFLLQPVTTGKTTNGKIEITSPLPESDIVLVNAYALLMMLKNNSEEG